MSKEIAQDVG